MRSTFWYCFIFVLLIVFPRFVNALESSTELSWKAGSTPAETLGTFAHRVAFLPITSGNKEDIYLPANLMAVYTDWADGATNFGTRLTLFAWNLGKNEFEQLNIDLDTHLTGDGGGGHSLCYQQMVKLPGTEIVRPAFMEVIVDISFNGQVVSVPSPISCFAVDVDSDSQLSRRAFKGQEAQDVLSQFRFPAVDYQEFSLGYYKAPLNQAGKRGDGWCKVAQARELQELGEKDKARIILESLAKELKPLDAVTIDKLKTFGPRDIGKVADTHDLHVENWVFLKMNVEHDLRVLDGKVKGEEKIQTLPKGW